MPRRLSQELGLADYRQDWGIINVELVLASANEALEKDPDTSVNVIRPLLRRMREDAAVIVEYWEGLEGEPFPLDSLTRSPAMRLKSCWLSAIRQRSGATAAGRMNRRPNVSTLSRSSKASTFEFAGDPWSMVGGHHLGMAFHVRHRYGGNDSNPPLESLDELLDEVEADPSDHEHVGVGVVHESGWCVSVGAGWIIHLENVELLDIAPRHINVAHDRARALHVMRAAAAGDLATLEAEPWQPGYE